MFSLKFIAMTSLVWIGGIQAAVASAAFDVTMDTSALSGASALIAFDFIDGDTLIDNIITISGFASDGAYDPATAIPFGDVTGALSTSVVLSDSQAFNELAQPITLGNTLSFMLNLTNQFSGIGLPDRLTVFLLDAGTFFPLYPTADPTGSDALFAIELGGAAPGAVIFAPTGSGGALVQVSNALPEPPVWLLWLLGAPIGRYFLRTTPRRN
jgi:hypothetical protein